MLNFTVGPVASQPEILEVAAQSAPYFRTSEFSQIMLENEKLMLKYVNAPTGSRCVFLTTSGTGAMESCIINVLNRNDKIICINGGTFGQRFVDLCHLQKYEYTEIKCEFGKSLDLEKLEELDGKGYTALLINMHETSSGVLYNMESVSEFCKRNQLLLVIDAISSFIADDLDMEKLNADVVIAGSQKALAVQAGVSMLCLSAAAIKRIWQNEEKCHYLSLKEALKNMERGQTPFTPAVTTLLQINTRLNLIEQYGGIENERQKIRKLAHFFREQIKEFPLEFVVEKEIDRSNAVTAIRMPHHTAHAVFNLLKDEFSIWVCPNGGVYQNDILRVGHLGNLSIEDYESLFTALKQIQLRGCL